MRSITICLTVLLAILIVPAAGEVTVNDKSDIAIEVFVPCANGGLGEIVLLEGPLHTVVTATVNGNKVSGRFHFQPQGVNGTGLSTGLKYQGTGATQQSFNISLQNGQANFTSINNFRIVGQGPGNNFLVHESMHITITADGTMTVFHDNLSIDCK